MKKIFTLFAVAAMAMSAYAETPASKTWNFSEEPFASKESMSDETVDGLEVLGTMNITNNNKTFEDVKYTKRLQTGGKSSETNRVMKFEVPGACTISTICCSASSSDATRVVSIAAGTYDNVIGSGTAVATGVDKISAEYTGTDATTIFIYAGGGVNFYAVSYASAGETPVTPETPVNPVIPTEGETFTLEGVYPTGDFGTIKSPITVDYDTKTITMSNFLGGNEALVFTYALRDENANPTMPGTMFNLTPVSGVTENGSIDNYGVTTPLYDLNGLKTVSPVFTKDDVKTICLNAPQIIFGTNSSMEYKTGGKYEITLYLSSKNQQWSDDKWGKEDNMGFFNLKITVPASGNQSGIEDIVAGEDENAPVEYYNLQGVRISEPAAGQVVIRRQGSKVTKIVVR